MRYTVKLSATVVEQITEYARFIAEQRRAPENAQRWLERVYDAIDTLDRMPQRCGLAPENAHRPYEIRRLLIGQYVALFTIVEDKRAVHVVGFRHGHRFPRLGDLPAERPE
jgi:plasmid stabilization system protein ParE